MLRIALGVLAGIVVGGLLVGAVEFAGMTLFPAPAGLDFSSPEAASASMSQVPALAVASVGVAWTVAALGGGYVAARLSQRQWAAWVIAALLIAASLYNLIAIPSPVWLWVGGLAGIVIGGWLGGRLGAART